MSDSSPSSKKIRAFHYPAESFRKPRPEAELPVPSWSELEDRYGLKGITLEIGCGVGLHPIQACLKDPTHYRIAVEHTAEKFSKFRSRLASHRNAGKPLDNLLALHGNVIEFVARCTPEDRPVFGQIDLMYPNPNWKAKLASQRWFRMPFMGRLLQSLHEEGTIRVVSNLEEYVQEAELFATKEWGLQSVSREVYSLAEKKLPPGFETLGGRTHFEIKYLASGQDCHERVFRKLSKT